MARKALTSVIVHEDIKKAVEELPETLGIPVGKETVIKEESSLETLADASLEELQEKVEACDMLTDDYIKLNGYFVVNKGIYSVIKRNILRKVNTLLLGPTGVGKTELICNIASSVGVPITVFDMGTMTDPIMSLVGNHVIKMHDGVTTSTFVKSRFSDVIQQPGIILLDELSRAVVTSNNLLFPCLDSRRELPMEYSFEDNKPIKVHPDCVFIATANLGGQYTGTHKLDRALIDRFMLIEIDPLKGKEVKNAIKLHCPKLSKDVLNEMVKVYSKINKAHAEFTVSFSLSIRHLKLIAELVEDGYTLYDSFYIICKGIGSKEGLEFIKSAFKTEDAKTEDNE